MMNYSQPIVDPNYDAHIFSKSPTVNFGTETSLAIGHDLSSGKDIDSDYYHSLFWVDLSSYIGSTILSGRLLLKTIGSAGSNFTDADFHIHRCGVTDWTELGCTWDDSGVAPWTGGAVEEPIYQSLSGLSDPDDLDFDGIAALIQDALDNRGGILSAVVTWIGSQESDNVGIFGSSENAGNEPLLEFTYELSPKAAADTLEMTQLVQNSVLSSKDPFAECLTAIPPIEFAVGIFENQIRLVLNRIASEHPGYRIPQDDDSFAAVLALDQPRQYLTALERRVIKFLQHHADGCVISPREPDDACDPNEGD